MAYGLDTQSESVVQAFGYRLTRGAGKQRRQRVTTPHRGILAKGERALLKVDALSSGRLRYVTSESRDRLQGRATA